ncbi:CocE/NonD family hydrolase [Pseudorhodoplanes sp.]|uniref:CocE/NonD family hydrolase n=1 Tax=Pseudorhodoplanes sp. TaxID=1934341 RepID=UPI002CF57E27|nr:CocE/NonD family hydrolase [Pseudorhodoplanes sp.]HWV43212.1 CocE/NonD family hydrolase [Pseudorhodoplanes sp.]
MHALQPSFIANIRAADGIELAAAVYLPEGKGRFPTLFAASPYRFDNNVAPATPIFLWRETGPIDYYLSHGYAFVHLDVRGTGRSGGEYRYMCPKEQRDLYDVIVWITQQSWSNGKVGGIGQSYYARMQWFMGIQNPPGLACIAPYDGNVDTYRSSAYTGGIPGAFPSIWYNSTTRNINQYPASGPSRLIEWDYVGEVKRHTTYDTFWKERAAAEHLDKIKVPVFSIGVWTKVDLHLNGNIVGFQRTQSPKKLLVFGSSSLFAAVADFSSIAFHETYLRPFYDCYLKGEKTSYLDEPDVRYFVPGAEEFRTAKTWPPENISYRAYYLGAGPTGSVTSLNDGSLSDTPQTGSTSYDYPNPQWRAGVVGFDKSGRPDPVRNVLTFTSAPLDSDLEIAGPIQLNLYASSSNSDTDFIVKLSEQFPRDAETPEGAQPRSRVVTKGWLRASHRAIDAEKSLPCAPWYSHVAPEPIEPGKIYLFQIAVMPTANRFRKGSRIRLEIANGDSQLTEFVFQHDYTPDKVGRDTLHHSSEHPSHILLPVVQG